MSEWNEMEWVMVVRLLEWNHMADPDTQAHTYTHSEGWEGRAEKGKGISISSIGTNSVINFLELRDVCKKYMGLLFGSRSTLIIPKRGT